MNKKYLSIFLLFATMAIVCVSCSRDDSDSPSGNSTNSKTTAVFSSGVTYGTMTDRDGNTYKTIAIGTQTWMAENLRTTTYNDGTAIPNVTKDDEWGELTNGAYCNYNNTISMDTIATFGCLYNWYAVNTGKLAPKGWHVPTDTEWATLIDYLGGVSVAGGKLKEIGSTHWKGLIAGATNETGFTALPGGGHGNNGTLFYDMGYDGFWWSSTMITKSYGSYAISQRMSSHHGGVGKEFVNLDDGCSVRCVKD
jgi:uncharacterized protein (TIGR02145 family)